MKILIAADVSACTRRMRAFIAAHDEWLGPRHRCAVLHGSVATPVVALSPVPVLLIR
jgi:nucleotide-binding universal stress UspA family protein